MLGRDEILAYLAQDLKHSLAIADKATSGTPLHLAAEEGRASTVTLLLRMGASATARNALERTPLHVAAAAGKFDAASALLAGSWATPEAVDYVDARGHSALHLAAAANDAASVRVLLSKGANPARTDREGKTPRDLARDNRAQLVLPLLP